MEVGTVLNAKLKRKATDDGSSSRGDHKKQAKKYDVFLSFRGEDTRLNFVDHLYAALHQKGILTFKDDRRLEHGKSISTDLLKAIEESRVALVILSPNYATSSWCLDELLKIVQCMHEMGQRVIPIFHGVEPSDVRDGSGKFSVHLRKVEEHEEVYWDRDKLNKWRAALRDVADRKGWDLRFKPQAESIQSIVKEVLKLSLDTPSNAEKGRVGMESRVDQLLSDYIRPSSDDVRIIGIHGMRGIGKTTVAEAVYDQICQDFDSVCFLSNVREISRSRRDGLVSLQEKLLSIILKDEVRNIGSETKGAVMISRRSRHQRVLLIIDDVDQLRQLEALAASRDWFGPGSRIIITTTDEHVLKAFGVDDIYKATGLNYDDALQLLSSKAFKKSHPPEDYVELCNHILGYAHGLPLALVVIGSFLYGRSINEWKSAIDRLKKIPEREIFDVLQISFDGLSDTEKQIFLHIACFYKGKDRDRVTQILEYCELYPDIGLRVLADRCLITISDNEVWMHDLLQELGWEIVRRESLNDPGKRSRLWSYEVIDNVMMKNKGSEVIQGIVMDLPKLERADWKPEAFSNLSELRFLQIRNVHLPKDLTCFPNSLRLLEWSGYPSRSLPQEFQPEELIELNLCHSNNISQLWQGIKYFPKLKFIKISHSHNIVKTPDFTGVQNLETLDLEGCKNLVEIHQSLGFLKKLIVLNLKDCGSLRSLPGEIEMESLETFILSGCSKVKQIPEFVGNMVRLSELCLNETAIEKLPVSIEHLRGLASLNLSNCKNLVCLPSTISRLESLTNLNLSGCLKLGEEQASAKGIISLGGKAIWGSLNKLLPSRLMGRVNMEPMSSRLPLSGLLNLTYLNLSNCNLGEEAFPKSIGCLPSLVALNLSGNKFCSLPSSIRSLSKLENINLENCKGLRELSGLPSNSKLDVRADGCSSLQNLFDASNFRKLEKSYFDFLNCFQLTHNQVIINALEMLKIIRSQGTSNAGETFQIVIPGSGIPKWFSHRIVGSTLIVDLSPCWNNRGFMGYALCAIFVIDENHLNGEGDRHEFKTFNASHHLVCCLKLNGRELEVCGRQPAFRFSEEFGRVESDHLWLFYVSREYFGTEWHNSCSQIEFFFETRGRGLKVKKCGVRFLYEQDVQDIQAEGTSVGGIPEEFRTCTLEELI